MGIFGDSDLTYLNPLAIINQWSTIVPEAAGRGEKFFGLVEKAMNEMAIPTAEVKRKKVHATKMSGKDDGGNEPCLYIHATAFRGIDTYVVARDWGKHLLLSRYACSLNAMDSLSEFEKENLTAYLSFVHEAVLVATKEIMGELNKDFSKINAKSQGLIDIV